MSAADIGLSLLTKYPMENEVTMVDIGQGDSIFLRDMTGQTMLIDTGGRADFTPKEDPSQPMLSGH